MGPGESVKSEGIEMAGSLASNTSSLALFHDFALHLKDRRQMIAEAAYFKAEKRGFLPGRALDDWLEAEREIDEALRPLLSN